MISPEWEAWYANGGSIVGHYPAFERLIASHVVKADSILELGAGLGATIPFIENAYGGYHGVDGSASAVDGLRNTFPQLASRIKCADFCSDIPFDSGFDAVVDRASIAHNSLASIKSCLELVWHALKPGGIFICSDWFSASHSEVWRGEQVDDSMTRTGYPDGQFVNVGKVHFSSQSELAQLFFMFDGVRIEERIVRRPGPSRIVPHPMKFRYVSEAFSDMDYCSAVWDIIVRKSK